MSVQLGINPLTWTNDDLPSLGAETSLETCLSEGKEAGFAGFELGNKFPREARLLGPILQRHDLQLVSGWYSGRLLERSVEEEIAAVQSHLTLLRELGAKVLVFAEVSGCIFPPDNFPFGASDFFSTLVGLSVFFSVFANVCKAKVPAKRIQTIINKSLNFLCIKIPFATCWLVVRDFGNKTSLCRDRNMLLRYSFALQMA